jgi:hypothetical protein
LSCTVTEADRAPVAFGLNLTEMVQLAPAARLLPQVVVSLKSPAFVPVIEIPVIVTAAAPKFSSWMFFDALVVLSF